MVTVYAALGGSGATAGLWRSFDSGTTWSRVIGGPGDVATGNATDVVLDPVSGQGAAGGNLQIVYAAIAGAGVYSSPNQGTSWFAMPGTAGDPLIQASETGQKVPVNGGPSAPAGTPDGRITLAKPFPATSSDPSNPTIPDQIYEGWLYALVATPSGLDGLYLTKDYGQNWTKISLPAVVNQYGTFPSNDETKPAYDPTGGRGAFDASLAIDPTNPNVVYIGGNGQENPGRPGLLRVDTTALFDPHAFVAFDNSRPDTGLVTQQTTGPVSLISPLTDTNAYLFEPPGSPFAVPSTFLNLIRDPNRIFDVNATLITKNVDHFNNTGANARVFTYLPNAGVLNHSRGLHRIITTVDPLTGHARLLLGTDHGVFTGVDTNGVFTAGIGTDATPLGTRNGNLSITQFYYGAVQPSTHNTFSGKSMDVIFYGGVPDVGAPLSGGSPNDVLGNGNIGWNGPLNVGWTSPGGDSYGVATDPGGSGTVYRFIPAGQAGTNFFQVNGVGRTFNLTTGPGDPQWFNVPPTFNGGETAFGNFAVNTVNGNQVVISSSDGTIYRTEDQAKTWHAISNSFGSYAPAVTFGAPDPKAPAGIGNLDNFIYAGTLDGHIYVTTTGGGGARNQWQDISAGINGEPVQRILTNPNRGSHEAYAVTLNNVYHTTDSLTQPWTNITGNLYGFKIPAYNSPSAASEATTLLTALTAMQVDWRYQIPNNPANPGAGTHPVLYVSGDGGVFRSLDGGASWSLYPTTSDLTAATVQQLQLADGGYLPNARVADLSMASGNYNPVTGRATWQTGDPDLLVASTYGRGQFMINLAPWVKPGTTPIAGDFLGLDPSTTYTVGGKVYRTTDGKLVTTSSSPVFDGYSEQSAFGNTVNVGVFDLTNPASPVAVPLTGSTLTDGSGKFKVTVNNYFVANNLPSGVYTFGFQSTDQTGAKGNMAVFTFVYEKPATPAPLTITMDPATDSGTRPAILPGNDDYTNFNNSLPVDATHPHGNAPGFIVTGVLPNSTVYLVRASQVGGVVGSYTVVASVPNPGNGSTVEVYDTNGGNGAIPDTPVNAQIDTAPPQPNQYLYSAYQVDSLNLPSPIPPDVGSLKPLPVIIDSTAPNSPQSVTLDPSTDSGTKNNDGYTNVNNSKGNAPLFDVTGIEPHATIQLLRDYIDPKTGKPTGTWTVVNTVYDVTPTGPKNTVVVPDINVNNSVIPDSPVGTPPNTAPPAGFPYIYSAIQLDLAGNPSKATPSFGNRGAIVLDGTDSDFHGDNTGGVNNNGWKYMQKVLEVISPNVTNGQKVLVALGATPSNIGFGAGDSIESAFALSGLPGKGWTIVHVLGLANMDNFLKGLPANATDKNNQPAGTVTIGQTGLLYVPSANETGDDLNDADLTMLNTHGPDIQAYLNGGGALYTQCETPSNSPGVQNNPPGYGWLQTLFPGIGYFSEGSGGFVSTISLTPAGQAIFPTLTSADLSTGPWHGFYTGTIPTALVPIMTAPDEKGVTEILGLSTVGATVTTGTQVIIDSTPPVQSVITLDPSTDSGTYPNPGPPPVPGDQVTNFNNSPSPGNAPVFDVTNVEPNGIVKLFRTPVDPVTHLPTGPAVLVNTVTQAPGGTIGTMPVPDINAPSNGPIPDGTYSYTTQQTDLAGNVGATSAGTVVTILTKTPATPTGLQLDPAYNAPGTFDPGFGHTHFDNSAPSAPNYPAPRFDVSGIIPSAKVELFRAPINPATGAVGTPVLTSVITDVKNTPGAGGLVTIDDVNMAGGGGTILDGLYQYTVMQLDVAGNASKVGVAYKVEIDTDGPQADPPAAPVLEPGSDSGTFNNDQVTNRNNNPSPANAPVFDAGTGGNPVEAGATVELFRTPLDPVTKLPTGPAVLVNKLVRTAGGVVPIADINAPSHGPIPDGTYSYTIQLVDLAGVPGSVSAGLTVVVLATPPGVPSPFRLDAADDTGVSNSDGITQITLFHPPHFDVGAATSNPPGQVPVLKGATLDLYRTPLDPFTQVPIGPEILVESDVNEPVGGLVQIIDATNPTDGLYRYRVQQIDLAGNPSGIGNPIVIEYDTAQPPLTAAPVLLNGTSGKNQTSAATATFSISFSLAGFEVNSSVTLLRDGKPVATSAYVAGTPPTATSLQLTDPGDPDPANPGKFLRIPFGLHTYQAFLTNLAGNKGTYSAPTNVTFTNDPPGTIVLDPGSDSGTKNDNITNVTQPFFDVTIDTSKVVPGSTLLLLRGGLTVATKPIGTTSPVVIQDLGPGGKGLVNGKYTYTAEVQDPSGKASPPGPALTITIDTNTPVAPSAIALDPKSDSGLVGDGVTNVDNAPVFDVSGVVAGATLYLFRAPYDTSTRTIGTPVQVNKLVGVSGGTVAIADLNLDAKGNPQLVPDGTYYYYASQDSPAGNPSPKGAPAQVTIDSSVPAAPGLVLDPASHRGSTDPNTTSVINPFFDASNVLAGATLTLYRNGAPVKTLRNTPAGTVMIQDPGPLANGRTYAYYVVQSNVAGTSSPLKSPPTQLNLTINTSPPAFPTDPTLSLDVTTDTGVPGDGVTASRLLTIDGTADPGVLINLYDVSKFSLASGKAVLVATTSADGLGNFQVALPTTLTNGVYTYAATATDNQVPSHTNANAKNPLTVRVVTVDGDYAGSGKTGLGLFRRVNPYNLTWYVPGVPALNGTQFGAGGLDVPMTGDFLGTTAPGVTVGQDDPAIYRMSTADWFVQDPANGYAGKLLVNFGWPNHDVPAPGNYYGTNLTIPGVFRPGTGEFFVYGTKTSTVVVPYKVGDQPVPANYNNTGKDELAVYRPGAPSTWYIMGPPTPGNPTGVYTISFGGPSDIPVPGAYDATAAGQVVELAVYRPATGQFFVHGPGGNRTYQFSPGDIPAPGDYDGIGVTEPAVYRPSTGQYFVYGPSDDVTKPPRPLGKPGDPTLNQVPLTSPYSPYRALGKAGGITGFAVKAGGHDFGTSALSLTSAPVSAPVVTTPPPFAAAAPAARTSAPAVAAAAVRARPSQSGAATPHHGRHHHGHLVDQALGSVSARKKGHGPLGNL